MLVERLNSKGTRVSIFFYLPVGFLVWYFRQILGSNSSLKQTISDSSAEIVHGIVRSLFLLYFFYSLRLWDTSKSDFSELE